MELTAAAAWLNETFAAFDYGILSALHALEEAAGGFFTPFFTFVSLFAHDGLGMIFLGLLLLCFRRTRRVGLCVFLAVGFGAVLTNLTIKDLVARPRPFVDETQVFRAWWEAAGAHAGKLYNSFPSGHTTATMGAMTGVFLTTSKRKSWPVFFAVLLMGVSRNYLMVHYPSDVLGGILMGAVGAGIAYGAVCLVDWFCRRYAEWKLVILWREWDLAAACKKVLPKRRDG